PNAARNTGAQAARGGLLLYCDADDVVDPGWVGAMQRARSTADVLCGVLDDKQLNAGIDTFPRRRRLPRHLGFLPFALGGNLGIQADVLAVIGGWNPTWHRPGRDEIDLSWRAQLMGHTIALVP